MEGKVEPSIERYLERMEEAHYSGLMMSKEVTGDKENDNS
jgi:hypothetical protein